MNNYSLNQIDKINYDADEYNPYKNQSSNNLNNISNNFYKNKDPNEVMVLGNLTNDNLINMANSIDTLGLNGTNLDDNDGSKVYNQRIKNDDNTSLIKSLTKEIINNLKDNNMSLYDNSTINSRSKFDDNKSIDSESSNKKHKNKKKNIKDTIENFIVTENKESIGYVQWFFDDCFNYKDFLILFILYFILSQEMIKDFFSKYFTSLNPDTEGKVGVQGVIIYGLILTILYMILKKFF